MFFGETTILRVTALSAVSVLLSACGGPARLGKSGGPIKEQPSGAYVAVIQNRVSSIAIVAGSFHPFKLQVQGLNAANGTVTFSVRVISPKGQFIAYRDSQGQNPVSSLSVSMAQPEINFWVNGTAANQQVRVEVENSTTSARQDVRVIAGTPSSMEITWSNPNVTTDTSLFGSVVIRDSNLNVVQHFSGTIVIDSQDTDSRCATRRMHTHAFDPNVDAGSYQFSNTNLGYCTLGSKSLRVSSTTHSTQLSPVTSNSKNVGPGLVASYIVSGAKNGPTNTSLGYTAIAVDRYQYTNTNYSEIAEIRKRVGTGSYSQLVPNQAFQLGRLSFNGTFPTQGSWDIHVRQNSANRILGSTSTQIGVTNYWFVVSAPVGNHKLGNARFPNLVPLTVKVYDNNNRTVLVSYGSSANPINITFSSSDPQINNGTIRFTGQTTRSGSFNFSQLGSPSVQATGANGFGNPINVSTIPGDPAHTTMTGISSSPRAYLPFNAQVTVFDSFNNLITGRNVSLRLKSEGVSGFDLARTTNSSNAIAAFNNIRFTSVGVGQVKVFSGNNGLQSKNVNVIAGPLHHVAHSTWPSSIRLNQAADFRVNFLDEGGNAVIVSGGSVSLTSNPSNLIQQKLNQGFSNADHYIFTNVQALSIGNGTAQINVSAGSFSGSTGGQGLSVTAGVPHHLVYKKLVLSNSAGASWSFDVEVQDIQNNLVSSASGAIGLNFSRELNSMIQSIVNGVARFSGVRFLVAGQVTLSVSYSGVSNKNAVVNITHGALQRIIATGPAKPVQVGTPFPVSFILKDAHGNTVTSFTGPYSIDEGTATKASGNLISADKGQKTHLMTLNSIGNNRQFVVRVAGVISNMMGITVESLPVSVNLAGNVPFDLYTSETYMTNATIKDSRGNPIPNRAVELLSNAPGWTTQTVTTNSKGIALFSSIRVSTPAVNVWFEFRDSVITTVKNRIENLKIYIPGGGIAYNTFLPPANRLTPHLQVDGFPVNIDIYTTILKAGVDWSQMNVFWDADINNSNSKKYLGKTFSHVYPGPGSYNVSVVMSEKGQNPISLKIPITIYAAQGMETYWVSSVHPGRSDALANNGKNQNTPFASIDRAFDQYKTECGTAVYCPRTFNIEGNFTTQARLNVKASTGVLYIQTWPNQSTQTVVNYSTLYSGKTSAMFYSDVGVSVNYFKVSGNIKFVGAYNPLASSPNPGQPVINFFNGSHHYFDGVESDNLFAFYKTDRVVPNPSAPGDIPAAMPTGRNSIVFNNVTLRDHYFTGIQTGGYHLILQGVKQEAAKKVVPLAGVILYGAYRSLMRGCRFEQITNFNTNLNTVAVQINSKDPSLLHQFANSNFEAYENEFYVNHAMSFLTSTSALSNKTSRNILIQRNTFFDPNIFFKTNDSVGINFNGYVEKIHIQNNTFRSHSASFYYSAVRFDKGAYTGTTGAGYLSFVHNSLHLNSKTSVAFFSDHVAHSPQIFFVANSVSLPGADRDISNKKSAVIHLENSDYADIQDGFNLTYAPLNSNIYRMKLDDFTELQWRDVLSKGTQNIINTDPKYLAPDVKNPIGLVPANELVSTGGSMLVDYFTGVIFAIIDRTRLQFRPLGPKIDVGAFERKRDVGTGGGIGVGSITE